MARGLYQYETSPRKLEPSSKPRKKQSINQYANNRALIRKNKKEKIKETEQNGAKIKMQMV